MAPTSSSAKRGFRTEALHADDAVHHATGSPAVGPNLSVSTTFRYPTPAEGSLLAPGEDVWASWDPHETQGVDVYSRYTQPTLSRAEKVLSSLCNGHALVYGSGLSAALAILLHVQPDVIAITDGYHGCHETIALYKRVRGTHCSGKPKLQVVPLDSEYPKDGKTKVLCWVETPLNPTGEIIDIAHYAKKVHACSPESLLVVDSTFGPPPLQDPFVQGADIIMHSGTKYFSGHSDALIGVLVVKPDAEDRWHALWHDRTYTGSAPGSLEAWLLLRSLRTLHVRVPAQSATALALASWLTKISETPEGQDFDGVPGQIVTRVWHGGLQDGGKWIGEGKQMPGGGPATFSFMASKPAYAKWLPFSLSLFTPATSLGGVESLMEQRSMSDPKSDHRLLRVSVGLENIEDLVADLRKGFAAVIQRERENKL